jgi:crossover junction endodeoxyribonuclease RuvC
LALILGIDPGLTRCGVGLIRSDSSRKVSFEFVDLLESSPRADLSDRLATIGNGIKTLIETHNPDHLAVERVFTQQNLKTVTGIAQVSGLAIYFAASAGIPVSYFTPSEVKAAITGNGRADKDQVGFMVAKLLGLAEVPKPADAADALAIAICAAWKPQQAEQTETTAQAAWRQALKASKS